MNGAQRPDTAHQEFASVYQALAARLEAERFIGWDPFDALNSRLFEGVPVVRSSRFCRLLWTQVLKQMPNGVRRAAHVTRSANPISFALAARSYKLLGDQERGRAALARLLDARSDPRIWGGGAWGYPFPWQARAFFVPRHTPNVIATAYAVRAVVECADWVGHDAAAIVSEAGEFVARTLRRTQGRRTYFAYVPGSDAIVHNANLWGAYVACQAMSQPGQSADYGPVLDAIALTTQEQRADGSWPYGQATHHRWTDGFHTGYVLEALNLCGRIVPQAGLQSAVDSGGRYYFSEFMRDDGTCPYFAGGLGPLDANNYAQMAITLSSLSWPGWRERVKTVLQAAIRDLWVHETSSFAYQKRGSRKLRAFFPRWTQVWMQHALAIGLANASTIEGRR